jgi:hypothetical protein
MRDVGSIAKGDRNKDQGFDYRGIDATMNTVGPAFREHGVSVLPVGVEILESERYESKRGAAMHGMVTRHDWLVLGPTGEALTYPDGSPGHPADAGAGRGLRRQGRHEGVQRRPQDSHPAGAGGSYG